MSQFEELETEFHAYFFENVFLSLWNKLGMVILGVKRCVGYGAFVQARLLEQSWTAVMDLSHIACVCVWGGFEASRSLFATLSGQAL